jgi:hypothetical protein
MSREGLWSGKDSNLHLRLFKPALVLIELPDHILGRGRAPGSLGNEGFRFPYR